jgi:amino acid transporter
MVAMSLDRLLPAWVSKVDERLHTPVNAHLVYFLFSLPVIWAYNKVGGWLALTLGVTFACGYVFAVSALAGAALPFRAKEVYDASPGSKYTVNGIVAFLFTLVGFLAFILIGWILAPMAFTNAALVWIVRLGVIVAALAFMYPFRGPVLSWLRGEKAPWLSALGFLGGGVGMAMVLAFLLAPSLGVLGNWNFANFPAGLWAQIIAFGLILISAVWYFLAKAAQKRRGIDVDYAFKEIPPE